MIKKITKLLSTRDGNRVNIYLNEEYSFTVEKNLIADFKLYIGKEITDEMFIDLQRGDLKLRLLRKASEKIGRRAHSVFEIKQYLKQALFKLKVKLKLEVENESEIYDFIINQLTDLNYLNDTEFASWFVEIKKEKKSKFEIKKQLMQKGVHRSIVDKVLSYEDEGEVELIKKLSEKKLRLLRSKYQDERIVKQKNIEFLMRKGFKYDEIKKIIV